MASWIEFTQQAPELAEFGKARFQSGVAYLGTLRPDGSPRVHPVTPILGDELFLFMEPTSPKGHDLRRDGRFAIHRSVTDTSGESGEVILTGKAKLIQNPELRALAVRICPYQPAERYILFEFDIESAVTTEYPDGDPIRKHWRLEK